ncbi:MAG: diaminopimelate decarboxylase family protein [Myxococcota bacterium]
MTLQHDVKQAMSVVTRALPHAPPWNLATWGLERNADGELLRGDVKLAPLLEAHGSPLYVVDDERLAANAARFLATPPGAALGCEPYYSYKTNPVPGVLARLDELGIGAEAASPYELWLALELGVAPERIVYNGPSKSAESLRLAIGKGIGLINLNGREEIPVVASLARELGRRPRVGIRVVVPGGRAGQFGEKIETGAALDAFRRAKDRPELEVVALHAHANGEYGTREELDAFARPLLAFADVLRVELGLALEILDFGGNLVCRTVAHYSQGDRRLAVTFGREPTPRPLETVMTIDDYVAHLVGLVERHAAEQRIARPRIFIEPGRSLTGDAQMLLTRVHAIRGEDDAGLTWAVLDAGINVAEPVPNEFHQLFELRPGSGPERLYRLTGPSCTLADQLYPAWTLPELAPGDGLAIMDAGAYFVSMSTCFSFPRPGVVSVRDGAVKVLRRPETYEDLVARDLVVSVG